MKAKITLPDATVIELEGDVVELAVLLPDIKGMKVKEQYKGTLQHHPLYTGWSHTGPCQSGCNCVSSLG